MNKRLLSIQYLRAFASISIVFYHFKWMLNSPGSNVNLGNILFTGGAFGVDLFFIISGFVFCISFNKEKIVSNRLETAKKFLVSKFFKLYPLILVLALLNIRHLSFRSLLLLLENYTPEAAPFFGYNAISPILWVISYDVIFYLLAALCIACSKKDARILLLVSIILSFIILNLIFVKNISLNPYVATFKPVFFILNPILAVLSSPLILYFAFGIILYFIYQFVRFPVPFKYRNLYISLFSVGIVVSLSMLHMPNFYGHGPLKFGIPAILLFTSSIFLEKLVILKKVNIFLKLGEISYSLFIIHLWVGTTLLVPFFIKLNLHGLAQLILTLAISIIIAYFLNRFIEKPVLKFYKKHSTKKVSQTY